MRDVNRIDSFLKELGDVWKAHPDLRFGQLVTILDQKSTSARNQFNKEEEDWIEAIKKFAEE